MENIHLNFFVFLESLPYAIIEKVILIKWYDLHLSSVSLQFFIFIFTQSATEICCRYDAL